MPPSEHSSGSRGDLLRLEHIFLLSRVDLFAQLDHVTVAQLATYLEPVAIGDGTVLCRQGEPADCLYIVSHGTFAVSVSGPGGTAQVPLATIGPGQYFGEMALLTDEPRSATVRAQGNGEVLRLDRATFRIMLAGHPSVARSLTATVCRRLREANQALLLNRRVRDTLIDHLLGQLLPEDRQQVLRSSILDRVSAPALQALFPEVSEKVAGSLAFLGVECPELSDPAMVALREKFETEVGSEAVSQFAQEAIGRLADAGCWEEATSVAARYADRSLLVDTLSRALRSGFPAASDRVVEWLEHMSDEEAAREMEVALAKASHYRGSGDPTAATQLLRKAIESARNGSAPEAVRRLKDTLRSYEEVGLTQRETEVLALLAGGLTNAEIAERLVISVRTAETHVNNVLGKLGCSTRARAAAWAVERGLVGPRHLPEG